MELEKKAYLEAAFDKFKHKSKMASYVEFSSGHINDTYLIRTEDGPHYVLQKINHGVFKDVPGLINNKVQVSKHILSKLKHLSKKEARRKAVKFKKGKEGSDFYYQDEEGNFWNMMIYIENSVTFEIVPNAKIAYEGGKLLGEFLNLTSDFDASKLIDVIPNFHSMPFRYEQFEEALKNASEERINNAKECIAKVAALKEEMHVLHNLKEQGEIKLRVTHNDTKISNTLFDKDNNGLCMIDTDTVMPGIVHYDFGDAIRTSCNTGAEDEADLSKVNFNVEFYKSYTKGFLEQMESVLTPTEISQLPLAAKTMIFIIGLRFLTDYLNNDIYFKTEYADHNLVRTKNQFKLIDDLVAHMHEIS